MTFEARSLDGAGNNRAHPDWGRAGTQYRRVAPTAYADGIAKMTGGPNARWISNRIFNDIGQNLFSENDESQWGWAWGQFIDHDLGLRDATAAEDATIPYTGPAADPLEAFKNDFGAIAMARTPAAPGTGTGRTPRQQIDTISSYIDGSNVYGVTDARLEWLREGPVDSNLSNNGPRLFLPGGFLPTADARGNATKAPAVELQGRLAATPGKARVAGDVRANENIALTAIHTLFAREHNRIVNALPRYLSSNSKFQIARRVVAAESQYITYNEFLPSLGVRLGRYEGYNAGVPTGLSNEFATVGYRAHSMVHGEFGVDFAPGTYTPQQLAAFRAEGIAVKDDDDEHALEIPLGVAFGNPGLLERVGIGPLLQSLSAERQYRNDEQIDNTLRSVLFLVPKPGTDPVACQGPVVDPRCFSGVVDLAAIDIQRGRDHGIPRYNDLRRAYGLEPVTSFRAITGEATERFPFDRAINASDPNNDANILDFVQLRDRLGQVIDPATDPDAASANAVTGVRRTTVAARLKAIYGSVDKIDAFVGMAAERHVRGTEFGELQLAIWQEQFRALRDGDRFFYLNDPALSNIQRAYGIGYRHSLADIIRMNTGAVVPDNVFRVAFS